VPELAEHWKLNSSHCMLGLYLHNIFSKLEIFGNMAALSKRKIEEKNGEAIY